MKIMVLNSEAELYGNGSDKILLLTLDVLSKLKNVQIEVILPRKGPLGDAILQKGIHCTVIPYPILGLRTATFWGIPRYCISLLWSTAQLYLFAKRQQIDIVYSNTLGVLQGALLRMLMCGKHIWHIHDIVDRPKAARKFLSFLIERFADLTICVSWAVKQCVSLESPNIRVVRNGIPPMISTPLFKKRDTIPTIIVLGRFNRIKGQQDMVKAAKILKEGALLKVPFRVRLVGGVYLGQNQFLKETKELIKQLNLEGIVTIEDCVEDVGVIFRTSHLLVVPSTRPDPFPTVALEAMSAGVPVVAYASGGLSEMLRNDTDCIAPTGNYHALAEKIQRFILDDNCRIEKAKSQYNLFKTKYTFEKYEHRLLTALKFGLGSTFYNNKQKW